MPQWCREQTHRQQAHRTRASDRVVSTAALPGPHHGARVARLVAGPMPSWSRNLTAWVARWRSGRSSGCLASAGPAPSAWPTWPDGPTQRALRPTHTRSTANPPPRTPRGPKPSQPTTSKQGRTHEPAAREQPRLSNFSTSPIEAARTNRVEHSAPARCAVNTVHQRYTPMHPDRMVGFVPESRDGLGV